MRSSVHYWTNIIVGVHHCRFWRSDYVNVYVNGTQNYMY